MLQTCFASGFSFSPVACERLVVSGMCVFCAEHSPCTDVEGYALLLCTRAL